ncbi:MAG: hypothetical protein H0W00_05155 [Chloroflexi bacterium]|nr:hypothetical protein [Chloroflexota bacterium]
MGPGESASVRMGGEAAGDDDVEGHGFKLRADEDDKDTEGQGFKLRADEDDKDTEGHRSPR